MNGQDITLTLTCEDGCEIDPSGLKISSREMFCENPSISRKFTCIKLHDSKDLNNFVCIIKSPNFKKKMKEFRFPLPPDNAQGTFWFPY
ncbi:unnamed protein product [Clavelina lepadiformis]|uniref:Uncharacterized protein n=1 Tax=Clavelina lepadiformis TaxID=159417 RepID=A0ABP0GEA5_CLALP